MVRKKLDGINEATPLLSNKTEQPKREGNMLETKHHWLPVIIAVYLPVTFVITYSIAVGYGHVKAGFPYISDTGTFPPESCVFGQLLNIGAVMSGILVYIRYRHIYILFEKIPERKSLLNLNLASFWIGMLTNLGVSMVGNFQESNVLPVHLLGAFLAFCIGFVYCVLQTVISFKTAGTSELMGNTPTIRKVRLVLCICNAIFIVIRIVALISHREGPGPGQTRYQWTSDDPGYTAHLIATISEWLAAVAIVIYFSTFYHEFKHFRVKPPEIVHYNVHGTTEQGDQYNNGGPSTITNNIM